MKESGKVLLDNVQEQKLQLAEQFESLDSIQAVEDGPARMMHG